MAGPRVKYGAYVTLTGAQFSEAAADSGHYLKRPAATVVAAVADAAWVVA